MNKRPTDAELREYLALAEQATPGPWKRLAGTTAQDAIRALEETGK